MANDDHGELQISDQIDGLPQPFEHGFFQGHSAQEEFFLTQLNSGRVHHAWLLSGPKGIGKATFVFRIARALLQQNFDAASNIRDELRGGIDPENRVFRQIAAGAHPNVLHMRIPYDADKKKFKTQLTVDEIRKTVQFFSSTAGEDGWRIAIVDSADDLNISAANALLKVLEEPPARTLFFLLSSHPGRLLPTIRSRCQHLKFSGLEATDIADVLTNLEVGENISSSYIKSHETLLGGSVRRAYLFAAGGNDEMKASFDEIVVKQSADLQQIHKFAEVISARGEDDRYRFFVDFVEDYLSTKLNRTDATHLLVRWAEVWEKVHERLNTADRLNLDRKQTVLGVLHDLNAH